MKKQTRFLAILMALLLMIPFAFSVNAVAPVADCTVAVFEHNPGSDNYYVTANVTFKSDTEFTAGLFTVEAEDLTLNDCTVAKSVGGEAPEVQFIADTNKVIFTGFSNSDVDDFRSYTELTLALKFKLNDNPVSETRSVAVENISISNVNEVLFTVADAQGVAQAHIHTAGDEWQKDETNHWKVCAECGEEVDKVAHTYNTVVTEPTCTEGGYTTYTCTVCGYSYVGNETSVAEHTVGNEWQKDADNHWKVCGKCDKEVYKADHIYNAVVTEPTCTEGGYTTYTCTVCGYSYVGNETSPTEHTLSDWLSDEKEHWHECTGCAAIVDKAAHTKSDWIIDKAAKIGVKGSKHKECTVCKRTLETEAIPALATPTYTITYKLNGGTNNSANPKSYKYNAADITLKNPTKKGYKFAGWYNGSAKITKIAKGTNKNITLTAKWSVITYKITYKPAGGKSVKNPTTYNVTTSTITLKNSTRNGYKFVGWYNGSKKVTTIKKGSTGNITLTAKWKAITYKITYKLGSGKNNSKNPKNYKVTTSTIKLKDPTRKGYTFKGWYKGSKKVTTIKKGSTGNITLTAKWKKK